jgi:ribosomal protein S18 acetylase RimI-like enzyme
MKLNEVKLLLEQNESNICYKTYIKFPIDKKNIIFKIMDTIFKDRPVDAGLKKDLINDNFIELVYDNDKLIGFCIALLNKPLTKNNAKKELVEVFDKDYKLSILDCIGILPQYQSQGIGKKLLQDFENASKNSIMLLGTHEHMNYVFYERNGYHRIASYKEGGYDYIKAKDPEIMKKIKMMFFKYT